MRGVTYRGNRIVLTLANQMPFLGITLGNHTYRYAIGRGGIRLECQILASNLIVQLETLSSTHQTPKYTFVGIVERVEGRTCSLSAIV